MSHQDRAQLCLHLTFLFWKGKVCSGLKQILPTVADTTPIPTQTQSPRCGQTLREVLTAARSTWKAVSSLSTDHAATITACIVYKIYGEIYRHTLRRVANSRANIRPYSLLVQYVMKSLLYPTPLQCNAMRNSIFQADAVACSCTSGEEHLAEVVHANSGAGHANRLTY